MGAEDTPEGGMLGRAIGNYVVERRLGKGGMGAVYLARHGELPGTYAAVKVLSSEDAERADVVERCRREAAAAATVGDHRVVRPIDVGRLPEGTPFILMEYVAGRSLSAVLREVGALPLDAALKIAYRVADTMALAHLRGVVHRDLKPSNVMLSDRGKVRILDFGVARVTGAAKRGDTGRRTVVGTPGYMAPEAATALGTDGRADVFSLGVMLFQMLTGEQPFAAPDRQTAVMNVLTVVVPPVSSRRPMHLEAVPPGVDALVARALEKDRDARLTMDDLRRALVDELRARPLVAGADGVLLTPISMMESLAGGTDEAPTLAGRVGEVAERLQQLQPEARRAGPPTSSLLDEAAAKVRRMPWRLLLVMLVALTAMLFWWKAQREPAPDRPAVNITGEDDVGSMRRP